MNDTWLAHYASKYYDPQKAHEYYMRTRELKGRKKNTRSTSALTDEGKEIWKVSKDSITTEKKGEVEKEKKAKDEKVTKHRDDAKATRERISAQLQSLNAKLSSDISSKVEQIRSNSKMSKQQKAVEIAKIRGEGQAERSKNSADAQSQRASVAADLRGVVQATREAYKAAKTKINESYEQIYQEEYDKIAAAYGKPKKGSKK